MKKQGMQRSYGKVLKTTMLLTVSIFIGISTAFADIAPNPANGGVPFLRFADGKLQPTQVAMQHEIVKLKVSPQRCDVHVVFTMKNTSDKDETMPVGFPYYYKGELQNFTASVDGKAMKVGEKAVTRVEDLGEYQRSRTTYWKLWDMTFAAGKETKVTVAYSTSLHGDEADSFVFGGVWLSELLRTRPGRRATDKNAEDPLLQRHSQVSVRYVLSTGRHWHGPIGQCRIEVDLDGLTSENFMPMNRQRTGVNFESPTHAVWERKNFEPKHEFTLRIMPSLTHKAIDAFLTERLTKEPLHVPTTLFAAHFRQTLGRQTEAQRLMLDLYRHWQDRIVLWDSNAKSDELLRHSVAVWSSLNQITYRRPNAQPDEDAPDDGTIRFTDKQIKEELVPFAQRMAKRVEAQLVDAGNSSASAKNYREQVAVVLRWCNEHAKSKK